MNESKRISKLFADLFSGSPWIDVNVRDTLKTVTAKAAAAKLPVAHNSIWQIVNHMISWRRNVLQRVNGKVLVTPSHNYFTEVKDTSSKAWKETLKEFNNTHLEWVHFLKTFDEKQFNRVYPSNNMTYYEHIHGLLQHDAYHLGQIVLLSKK